MSVAKRWTPFGSGNKSAANSAGGNNSTNYDPVLGVYDPTSPEAMMRKLADWAFMLRDFKLAQSTYDLLRSDFEHDSAWKYYAGANEMCLVSTLLNPTSRTRQDSIDRWLEAARHSYIHRCNLPFYALRTLLLASECLQYRGSLGVDEPSTWAAKTLEMSLPGPIGSALIMERIATFFTQKRAASAGSLKIGGRGRKRGLWSLLAAEEWVKLGKTVQAELCLEDANIAFAVSEGETQIAFIQEQLQAIKEAIVQTRLEALGIEEPVDQVIEDVSVTEVVTGDRRSHARNNLVDIPSETIGLTANPVVASPTVDEGFE
jgi:hypothetical protein